MAPYILLTNQKHAKNPIIPVSRKNEKDIMNMYTKYSKAAVNFFISNFVTKYMILYKNKYNALDPLVKKDLHHQL